VNEVLQQAVLIATAAHKEQTDKGGELTIEHAKRVMNAFNDEFSQVIAVLHDVVEDTYITIENIDAHFGSIVSGPIHTLTRRRDETYREYIERVNEHPVARRIKLEDVLDHVHPDRIHNLNESMIRRYHMALEILGHAL
jgi:(p)ppGpp synthase/HD superfamily hydrolase